MQTYINSSRMNIKNFIVTSFIAVVLIVTVEGRLPERRPKQPEYDNFLEVTVEKCDVDKNNFCGTVTPIKHEKMLPKTFPLLTIVATVMSSSPAVCQKREDTSPNVRIMDVYVVDCDLDHDNICGGDKKPNMIHYIELPECPTPHLPGVIRCHCELHCYQHTTGWKRLRIRTATPKF
ncbi:hypothetical protein evm_008685 [Chilo suppressalis]|nr:hypothetical protein evm_008685 [Chilo suppressalis]